MMRGFFKNGAKKLLNHLPPQLICRIEFKRQMFEGLNERAVEFGFVFKHLSSLCPQSVLDVGTGTTALPHLMRNCGYLVTASDNIRDYWPAGMSNRHYHVINDDITNTGIKEKFDVITCISVLEHIEHNDNAVRNMLCLLNSNGHLIMTFPYSENQYVKNVYELPGSDARGKNIPFICQSYSRKELSGWLADKGIEIVEQEYWQFWDGDLWTVGSKLTPPRRAQPDEKHQLTCVLIRKK